MKKLFSGSRGSSKKLSIRLEYLLFLLLSIIGAKSILAQNTFELSNKIERLTNSSELILEGEPIESKSYWNSNRTKIFTDYKVKVKSIFKGDLPDTIITVSVNGGIVEESFQFEFHNAAIVLTKPAYFFLKLHQDGQLKLADPLIGYVGENSDKPSVIIFNGISQKKQFFEDEIIQVTKFPKLSINEYVRLFYENSFLRNDTCNILTNLRTDNSIEFSFDSVHYTENFQYIEFDVMARVNTPGLKFARGDIYITYSNTFGSNAVNEGILKVFEGVITSNNLYSISYKDSTSQTIKVTINSSVGSNSLYTFSNTKASILHLKVKIEDFTQLANITFNDLTVSSEVYYWCQGQYHLFDQVGVSGPITATHPTSGNEVSLTYTLQPRTDGDNNNYKFDVLVYSSAIEKFSVSKLVMSYNALGFEPNQVAAATLIFSRGEVLSDEDTYEVELADFNSNGFTIYATPSFDADENDLYLLGTTPKNYGTLTLRVKNCEQNAGLTILEDQMQMISTYYTGDMPFPFEFYTPVIGENTINSKICGCSSPVITSFSPTTIHAGNEEILTITGSNFGAYNPFISTVMFRDGDVDNGYMTTSPPYFKWDNIVHWTDTEIKVKVPSQTDNDYFHHPAASGKFKVKNHCNEQGTSSSELTIPNSLINIQFGSSFTNMPKKLVLQGDEPYHNGMEFRFSSDIPTNGVGATVRSAFREALEEWCTSTNVNFTIGDDAASSEVIAADDINLIKYSDDLSVDALAGVVIFGHYNDANNECATNTVSMKDLDIKVKYNANATFDQFKNIFLHEMGHAHLLNHSRQSGSNPNWSSQYLMYYSLFPPNEYPSIRQADKEGAMNVFTRSALCINGIGSGFCETSSTDYIGEPRGFSAYPNPTSNLIYVEPINSDDIVSLINPLGQIIFRGRLNDQTLDVSNLSPGLYLLTLENKGMISVQKIIKL